MEQRYVDQCSNCGRRLRGRWTGDDIEGTYCCAMCLMVSLERLAVERDDDRRATNKLVSLFRRFPPGNARATGNASGNSESDGNPVTSDQEPVT